MTMSGLPYIPTIAHILKVYQGRWISLGLNFSQICQRLDLWTSASFGDPGKNAVVKLGALLYICIHCNVPCLVLISLILVCCGTVEANSNLNPEDKWHYRICVISRSKVRVKNTLLMQGKSNVSIRSSYCVSDGYDLSVWIEANWHGQPVIATNLTWRNILVKSVSAEVLSLLNNS